MFGASPIAGTHFWNFTSLAGGPAAGLAEGPVRDQSNVHTAPPPPLRWRLTRWLDAGRTTTTTALGRGPKPIHSVKRAGAPQAETFNRDTFFSSANRMAATLCIQACGVQFVYVCASLSLGSSLSTALAFYCSVCVKDERSTKGDGRAEPQLRLFPLPSARLHCSEKTKTKKQQDLLFETIVYRLALRYCFEVCF